MMVSANRKFLKAIQLFPATVLGCLLLPVSAWGSDQLSPYRISNIEYESTTAFVVKRDENGGGTLRIDTGDCDDCYEDAIFDANTHFNTPFGYYRGLDKLNDWSDRTMNISVKKETGKVVEVRIEQ